MQNFSDMFYWLATIRLAASPLQLRKLLAQFGDCKNLLNDSKQIIDWHAVEKDFLWCERNHCHLITIQDAHYPDLLRQIPDAPLLLFVKGDPELLSKSQVAIVGSRYPTALGKEIAKNFAEALTEAGLIVTSGLALGVDAASHNGALTKGKTIAVMGTGMQYIYPRAHTKLTEKILVNGSIVSEFLPNTPPKKYHFPRRNRLISGLSLGVLVVEAAVNSGSLITARYAMEQNREVFAIPGSIKNPFAAGCHRLIREGAKLVETPRDILEELGSLHAHVVAATEESMSHPLLQYIGFEVTAIDTIIARSGKSASEVASSLLILELEGMIATESGGYMRVK